MSTAHDIEVGHQAAVLPGLLDRFRQLFNQMGSGHLGDLSSVYSDDIIFTDPFSTVRGLAELTRHLDSSYQNVISCRFEFGLPVVDKQQVALPWIMYLRHKRLNKGVLVTVDGLSLLRIDGQRIGYHRDYFDAGQLLYENVPVLGRMIRWIRGQAV
jgi:limonene-1,2-epoxide hydrolase